jgi:Flp pilus assembly pilin Flp
MDARERPAFRPEEDRRGEERPDEAGQGLAEYGLILALIAVACIAGLQTLGAGIVSSVGFSVLPGAF